MRRILAVAFLVLLLGEWGSHGIVCAHNLPSDGPAVSSNEPGHEDPCKTMICNDSRRHEQQVPSGVDMTPHNALFDRLPDLPWLDNRSKDPLISFSPVDLPFRPISPPFHPPELI